MIRIGLFVAAIGFASAAAAQQPIAFSTEPYPPFSYRDQNGEYRGVGIDQVDLVMHDAGLPYTMEIMPWARAIALAETQPSNCVFAAARTPEREARFKWVVPLFMDRNVLVRYAGSPVTASSMEEAKKYSVGTYREDYTEGLLRSMGFPKIDLSPDVDTTLRKLLDNRIDMMPMSEGVFQKLRDGGTAIEEVMVFSEQQLGIACSREIPDETIARMQAGLDRLVRDGVQKAIMQRYGITPPR